jgi:tricorn protease-like protein
MKYLAPPAKIVILSTLLRSLLEVPKLEDVGVKILALVLGKIVSMLLSHGAILRVLSRAAQHIPGQHVAQFGCEGAVQISDQCRTEFTKLLDCLVIFNGQHIYSAASGVTVDINEIQQLKSRCRATGFAVSFYDGF